MSILFVWIPKASAHIAHCLWISYTAYLCMYHSKNQVSLFSTTSIVHPLPFTDIVPSVTNVTSPDFILLCSLLSLILLIPPYIRAGWELRGHLVYFQRGTQSLEKLKDLFKVISLWQNVSIFLNTELSSLFTAPSCFPYD